MSTTPNPAPEPVPPFLVKISVPANSRGSAERMRAQLVQMFAGVAVAIAENIPGSPSPEVARLENSVPGAGVDRMIDHLVSHGVPAAKVAEAAGELVAPLSSPTATGTTGISAIVAAENQNPFTVGERIRDKHTKKEHTVTALRDGGFEFGAGSFCPAHAVKHFEKV
jgi:hypothetical protein